MNHNSRLTLYLLLILLAVGLIGCESSSQHAVTPDTHMSFIYSILMNHNSRLILYLIFVLLAVGSIGYGFSSYRAVKSDAHMSFMSKELVSAYKDSVIRSSNPTRENIHKNLFAITKTNTKLSWRTINGEDYVLMANLFEDHSKFEGKNQMSLDHGEVWVTAFPEVYDFCMDYIKKRPHAKMADIGLRLYQLLGLPANKVGYTLVEFWVRPRDLFRPCPDPEISSEQCDINFPKDVKAEHMLWINQLRATTYADGYKDIEYGGFPWTQLGYTYDWSLESQSKIGLSEYVVKKGSKVYVKNVYTLAEYCQCGL